MLVYVCNISKMWFWRRNEENKYPGELNSFPRRLVIAQRRVGELSSRHDQMEQIMHARLARFAVSARRNQLEY